MNQVLFSTTPMTDDQVDQAVVTYRTLLEKHSHDFDVQAVALALKNPELGKEQFATFRRHVESVSDIFVRRVKVDPTRTPQEAIRVLGCVQYLEVGLFGSIPGATAVEAEIVFFKPGPIDSIEDLEREFKVRNLCPVDPVSLAGANEDDPTLMDYKPHATFWVDPTGVQYFIAFSRSSDHERTVCVWDNLDGWSQDFWCAGIRVP